MEKVCRYCEREFEQKKYNQTSCSTECQLLFLSRKMPHREWVKKINKPKVCKFCGGLFTSKNSRKVYCCATCNQAFNTWGCSKKDVCKKRIYKCRQCGEDIVLKYGEQKKEFCDKLCYNRFKQDETNPIIEEKCLNCDDKFQRRQKDNNRKFCGPNCAKQYGYKRSKSKEVFFNTLRLIKERKAYYWKSCVLCHELFFVHPKGQQAKYCSVECERLVNNAIGFYVAYGIKKKEIPTGMLEYTINHYKLLKTIKNEEPSRKLECNE